VYVRGVFYYDALATWQGVPELDARLADLVRRRRWGWITGAELRAAVARDQAAAEWEAWATSMEASSLSFR
jgi:hypothetical protein